MLRSNQVFAAAHSFSIPHEASYLLPLLLLLLLDQNSRSQLPPRLASCTDSTYITIPSNPIYSSQAKSATAERLPEHAITAKSPHHQLSP
ncbi:hypothetical protein BKA64DRAFT_670477 [Cadophora sp. MPI-SDFR-AT-0126]|nr:hypothetical protein BKA64DRAFT_670477 [Leotiomycetes sp. MPI-SDFR-AT-0126]